MLLPNPTNRSKLLIIPLFLPHHGCPHRCFFCNQKAVTGEDRKSFPSFELLGKRVDRYLSYLRPHHKSVQISFYGGNFLGLAPERISALLEFATRYIDDGRADGIRFSTRPDTIDSGRLRLLRPFKIATIEIGVQSMVDDVLARSGRGHTAWDTQEAVYLLSQKGYAWGAQLMVGLPGDTSETSRLSGQRIVALKPDFVRIYPTLVLKNSLLQRKYQNGTYKPLTLPEAVRRSRQLYLLFQSRAIRVIRMGLQASEELEREGIVAGPYHPAFGHLVHSSIYLALCREQIKKQPPGIKKIAIRVHPGAVSKLVGLRRQNIDLLKKTFKFQSIKIVPDKGQADGTVQVLCKGDIQ